MIAPVGIRNEMLHPKIVFLLQRIADFFQVTMPCLKHPLCVVHSTFKEPFCFVLEKHLIFR